MGQQSVNQAFDEAEVRAFTRAMLDDLRALEQLLSTDLVERGAARLGAEQEIFLIDADGRPAMVAPAVLARLDDAEFTTELGRFNLEANLPPLDLGGDFLRRLETALSEAVGRVDQAAVEEGAGVLLTGILPTLRRDDLGLHNMAPVARYRQLNDALLALGEGRFRIYIRGVDEIELRPDSVMLEAANTSFQLHLQVTPEDFVARYNLAQLISAPLLASAVNSPLLAGKRLWHETRVALFERSVDARTEAERERGHAPRVSFGSDWVGASVVELFRDAIARHPVVLTCGLDPPPLAELAAGRPPKLSALLLHNGTVWRWNRACYGVAGGVAHLRIENRVLPAGPTVLDQVANAALFYGLMQALSARAAEIPARLPFDAAKGNFIKAARQGLGAQLTWLDGRRVGAAALLREELIPAARMGLDALAVPAADLDRYLGVLEARLDSERTGARWMLDNLARLRTGTTADAAENALARLTRAMQRRQRSGEPVHQWPPVADGAPRRLPRTVGDIMSTDLFTVRPRDVVDLATSVMDWKHFRHVPVEANDGTLVGLVSHRALLRLHRRHADDDGGPVSVATIMDRDPPRVPPDLPLREALERLLAANTGCLVVVNDSRLVGLATERDFLRAAAALLADPTPAG